MRRSLCALFTVGAAVAMTAACSGDSAGGGGDGGAGGAGAGGGGTGGAAGAVSGGAAGTGASAGSGGSGGAAGTAGSGAQGGGGAQGGSGGQAGSGGSSNVWQPKPGTSWQWQLTGTIDTSVDVAMFDIDLFEAPQSVIDSLRSKGRIVICYFSAGSREDWRPDASDFNSSDYAKGLAGWPGENWLDIRSANVRAIMKKRLDLAVSKHCDGVEPDNVDGYANDTGFPLTEANQLDYLGFLSTESHARGLSVGLKNTVELAAQLVGSFDWALNEECLSYKECGSLQPFISAQKAVFHVEYVDQQSQGAAKQAGTCGAASIQGFSTLIKTWDLDAWRLSC